MTTDTPEDMRPAAAASSNPGRISLFLQPPGLRFHLSLAPAAVLLLWSVSVPGIVLFAFLGGAGMALVGSAVWLVRLIGRIIMGRRTSVRAETGARQRIWWLVAPVAGMLVVALTYSSLPLQIRWAVGKADFEKVIEGAPPAGSRSEWQEFDVPSRIGTYSIVSAARVGEGIIFYEASGAGFDDAGFAFLPNGPFPELESGSFEAPTYFDLGGGWYAWTASW